MRAREVRDLLTQIAMAVHQYGSAKEDRSVGDSAFWRGRIETHLSALAGFATEAPADCDSKATSLEPGASEQDAKKGAGSTPDETLRRVVCAAIRAADDDVMLGIRHYSRDMHAQMHARADGAKFAHRHDPDQGFVDQFGVYMSREEAYRVASAAGQIVRPKACGEGLDGPKLYSEGLY